MNIHTNTLEEQYRHAPLNGLIIATIVGAVWALVFLLWGVRGNFFMSAQGNYLMSVVFPVVGWMLGTVRADILHNNGTDIIRMSCVTVVAVFVSVIAWFYITVSLSLIFSSILDALKSSSWGHEIRS
ncbi:hypothetical protein U6X26_12015 [Cutibacterium acnes]|jgi:hypothetical protein|nr:hypothetical protein [Cutibacterium acnes]EFS47136.1 hypothetical protein HMPREF9580_00185 [Cutibacterium acnes HL087PA2]EFS58608.1 hypothetical protein HMPREF9604_01417 [Cutibacterium acnes HL036PA1]EFS60991.1 hypothetical protein HMPREF9605_01520 [Cutibacterium acnes HL036PA2]EFS89807.1 hypothetical protein HMPREF9606_01133 [Cutibacterium acnes HL036PA3]MCM4185361.1 adhesion protein-associated protein [Cutibacterium acnes P09]